MLSAVMTVPRSVNAPLSLNSVPSSPLSAAVGGVMTAIDVHDPLRFEEMSHGMKSTSVETGSPEPAPWPEGPLAAFHQLHSPSAVDDIPTARKPNVLPVMALRLM